TTRSKPSGSTASGAAAASSPGSAREATSTSPSRRRTGKRTTVPSRWMSAAVAGVQTSVTRWPPRRSFVPSNDPYEAPRIRMFMGLSWRSSEFMLALEHQTRVHFHFRNFTLLISLDRAPPAPAPLDCPDHDPAYPQEPFPRHEAAGAAQAERPYPRGALGALHPARSARRAVDLVPLHDRERQARALRRGARAPLEGLPARAALVPRRQSGDPAGLPRPAHRGGGERAARAGLSLLEGAPAGGDSRAPRADRDDRAPVRAPPHPLVPGDVAQRLSRPRARRRERGRAPLPARRRRPPAPVPPARPRPQVVRPRAGARAGQGPGGAKHGALVL